jgi:hypothetical protein
VFVSMETNLFAVNPLMSYVSKEQCVHQTGAPVLNLQKPASLTGQ